MKLFRQKDELFELMGKASGRRAGPTPTPHPTAGPPLAVRASAVAGKSTAAVTASATTGPTGTQRLGTRQTEPTPAPETPAPAATLTPAPIPTPTTSTFTGPAPTGVTSGKLALSNPPRLPQRMPPSLKTPTTTTTTRRRSLSPVLPEARGTEDDLFDIDGDALVVVDDGWNEATQVEGPDRTFAIRADTAIVGGLLASGLLLTAFLVGRTTTSPEAPTERPIPQVTLVQPTIDPSSTTSLPASVASSPTGEAASALTAGAPTPPSATPGDAGSSAPQAGFQPPAPTASPGKYELRVVTTTPEKAKALAAWLNEAPRSPIFGRGDLQVVVNGGSVKIQGFMQREPEVFSRVRATSDPTGGSGTFHDAYFAAVKVANSP
jgi:hypothetical protein